MSRINAFNPWVNGQGTKEILVGDPEGKPFIVEAQDNHWFPLIALVFAQSEEDAINRVRSGLEQGLEIEKNRTDISYHPEIRDFHTERAENILEALNKHGKAYPLDPRYTLQVKWGNSGIY